MSWHVLAHAPRDVYHSKSQEAKRRVIVLTHLTSENMLQLTRTVPEWLVSISQRISYKVHT